jgi:hypothetical protein
MMAKCKSKIITTGKTLESRNGRHNLLNCNESSNSFPLDFNPNPKLTSEEMALDYLASILVEIFLAKKRNEYRQQQYK